jgi:hypothetical protein
MAIMTAKWHRKKKSADKEASGWIKCIAGKFERKSDRQGGDEEAFDKTAGWLQQGHQIVAHPCFSINIRQICGDIVPDHAHHHHHPLSSILWVHVCNMPPAHRFIRR